MNFALSQDFLDCMAKAPQPVGKKARELISKFRMAPTRDGLNYERIQSARDRCLHSLRVDQDYRSIIWASPEGGNFVFLWMDKHDDAYAWATRRKVEINPEIGALQVYIVDEHVEQAAEIPAAQPQAGMFASFKDRELMRLGVPLEQISYVRSLATERELDSAEAVLPREAFHALFMLAAGFSYEDVVRELDRPEAPPPAVEDEALLRSPESRSQFFLVEDDQVLEEMLNAPLEKWRVFLHPSQRKLVERDWNGPVKVLGGPGTGKTVAALHRARWLARNGSNKDKPVLFTTFTKNLAEDIRLFLEQLCEPEEYARIEVINIDALARKILKANRFEYAVMFESSDDIKDLWQEALKEASAEDLPADFYREEWEQVIQPQQIKDLEAYKAASRAGRKTALSRSALIKVWPVFQTYFELLRSRKWIESQDAFFAAASLVGGQHLYESIVVDETQDMGIPALTFLRALVAEQPNDLFLVGDAHQTIYNRRTVLSKAGIQTRGRSRKLLLNYRTTQQIGRWASAYVEGLPVSDLDEGTDSLKGYRSLLSGNEPLDLRAQVPEEKFKRIHEYLSNLDAEQQQAACIACPSNDAVAVWKQNLDSWGIPSVCIGKDDHAVATIPGVKIATIHRIKGLEFDRMIVQLPSEEKPNARNLGFVAATRARRELVLV